MKILVSDIDPGDTPFVAVAQYLDAHLWTGDKILYDGLKGKGFNKVLNTLDLRGLVKRQ